MRQEIIKSKDGMTWIKFHLSPVERLKRFGRLLPDLFIPDFWDGEKTVYDSINGRCETFMSDLIEGVLGYWIGCHPNKEVEDYKSVRELFENNYHEDPIYKSENSTGTKVGET